MRALPILFLVLLAAPAHAATTVYQVAASGPVSDTDDLALKGVGFDVSEDVIVDSFSPYFNTTGEWVRFGIWQETASNDWTSIWWEDVLITVNGSTEALPQLALSAGESYFVGYWLDDSMGFHWTTSAQSDPAWGTIEGRLSMNSATFPETFTSSFNSALGGYRMTIVASTVVDADLDGWEIGDDCDDLDEDINPDAEEVCDDVDNNCDGDIDEGFEHDGDNDFIISEDCGGDDCDDENPNTFPGAPELCDGEDNDCDGAAPEGELEDLDGDGATACDDCDDEDSDVFPGQAEDCGNGVDDNCNGEIDESGDADGDGFGACDDCNDDDPQVHPDADEDDCNGVDDDCDGDLHPEEEDEDNDGVMGCEGDCDDDSDLVYPGAEEICDGLDNDCDGEVNDPEDCGDDDDDDSGDADDDDDDDDDDGGGGGGSRAGGCTCDAGGGVAALPLGVLLLVRRRRRGPA